MISFELVLTVFVVDCLHRGKLGAAAPTAEEKLWSSRFRISEASRQQHSANATVLVTENQQLADKLYSVCVLSQNQYRLLAMHMDRYFIIIIVIIIIAPSSHTHTHDSYKAV